MSGLACPWHRLFEAEDVKQVRGFTGYLGALKRFCRCYLRYVCRVLEAPEATAWISKRCTALNRMRILCMHHSLDLSNPVGEMIELPSADRRRDGGREKQLTRGHTASDK